MVGRGDRSTKEVRWHIYFSGEVQFVGFRHTAAYLANSLFLTGWVDNLEDGRVEMEAQGLVSRLRKLVIQLKAQPGIRITHMEITEQEPAASGGYFEIRGY